MDKISYSFKYSLMFIIKKIKNLFLNYIKTNLKIKYWFSKNLLKKMESNLQKKNFHITE